MDVHCAVQLLFSRYSGHSPRLDMLLSRVYSVHCKKGLSILPPMAGVSQTKLSLGRKNLIIPQSLVRDILAGDGHIENLFLPCNFYSSMNTKRIILHTSKAEHVCVIGQHLSLNGTVEWDGFLTRSLYPRYRIRIFFLISANFSFFQRIRRGRQDFSTTYEDFIESIFQPCEMFLYQSRQRTKCK